MAHILVVEDDPDIASLLSRGLSAAGHQVDWADTAGAAAGQAAGGGLRCGDHRHDAGRRKWCAFAE